MTYNRSTPVEVILALLITSLTMSAYACVSGQTVSHNTAQPSNTNPDVMRRLPASDSPKNYDYLELLDRDQWLAADFSLLWKTDDGGRTWKQSYTPKLEKKENWSLGGISFINAKTGFIVDRGILYRSDDGGNTWNEVGPIKAGGGEYFFEDCCFIDSLNGWAVGAMQQQDFVRDRKAPYIGAILVTRDGGMTWQRQQLGLSKGYFPEEERWTLRDVFFLNRQTGWAVGDQVIFRTEDGGETWHNSPQGKDHLLKQIRFLDRQFGWATMLDTNEILVTKDAGLHWKTLDEPAEFMGTPVEAVFVTPEHGFATTSDSNLYETRDGGRSWGPRRKGLCGDKAVYTFVDQAHDKTLMVSCLENGSERSLISTDNGITWHSNDKKN